MQLSLLEESTFPAKIISEELGVCLSTVANWLKSGMLKGSLKAISKDSYLYFKKNYLGTQKLNKRANKLHITSSLLEASLLTFENYEQSLPTSFRNFEGIFYTPAHIIENLCDQIETSFPTWSDLIVCDPCCGTGNFLAEAYKRGVPLNQLYGYDTDEKAIELAKNRFFDLTGQYPQHLTCLDFIENPPSYIQFDLIMTNPPWGKKAYKNKTTQNSLELVLYNAFRCIKEEGKLAFVLPDSFATTQAFEDLRIWLLKQNISYLADYGKAFSEIQNKAYGIIFSPQNKQAVSNDFITLSNEKGRQALVKTDFQNMPKHIFNFSATSQMYTLYKHLLNHPHTTLVQKADWALGIVTGHNDRYIKNTQEEGYVPIVRGKDLKKEGCLVKCMPTAYLLNDLSSMQQVASLNFYQSPKKIVYKFITKKLCFYVDTSKSYVLNSANILIPDCEVLGINMEQLVFLFNTSLYTWLHQFMFDTHKILRSDLEQLPIYKDYFDTHLHYNEASLYQFLNIKENHDGTFSIKK
jgi:site-specific DNA-methyltransferase (adenine-specific)